MKVFRITTCCWNIWFWSCCNCRSWVSLICCSRRSWEDVGEVGCCWGEAEGDGMVAVVVVVAVAVDCCWFMIAFSSPCICNRLLSRLIVSCPCCADMGVGSGLLWLKSLSMGNTVTSQEKYAFGPHSIRAESFPSDTRRTTTAAPWRHHLAPPFQPQFYTKVLPCQIQKTSSKSWTPYHQQPLGFTRNEGKLPCLVP